MIFGKGNLLAALIDRALEGVYKRQEGLVDLVEGQARNDGALVGRIDGQLLNTEP